MMLRNESRPTRNALLDSTGSTAQRAACANFDLPDHFLPEFPPPMYLTTQPPRPAAAASRRRPPAIRAAIRSSSSRVGRRVTRSGK